MTKASREDLRRYVEQWRKAGPELERVRRQELRERSYDPDDADALLELGDSCRESRPSSGMVEMQKWFMKLAEQQGLRPRADCGGQATHDPDEEVEE